MSYDKKQRIQRMLELSSDIILRPSKGSGRVYVATPVIRIQNPRKQYYTDTWRWQEGLSCQAGRRRATR